MPLCMLPPPEISDCFLFFCSSSSLEVFHEIILIAAYFTKYLLVGRLQPVSLQRSLCGENMLLYKGTGGLHMHRWELPGAGVVAIPVSGTWDHTQCSTPAVLSHRDKSGFEHCACGSLELSKS